MVLKVVHDTIDDIPEKYRDIYTEENGQWKLTGVEGLKSQDDITSLQNTLNRERNDHKATKQKYQGFEGYETDKALEVLRAFGSMDVQETLTKLDKIEEYKAGAEGKIDEEKMEQLVSARVKTLVSPVERKMKDIEAENAQLREQNGVFKAAEVKRTIHDSVRKEITESKIGKMFDTAVDDALMIAERQLEITESGEILTKDGVGVTPGVTVSDWFAEIADKKRHWFPQSQGGGAGGGEGSQGSGPNPWSKQHWNETKQALFEKEHGREKAEKMAKAVGSSLGAFEPPK